MDGIYGNPLEMDGIYGNLLEMDGKSHGKWWESVRNPWKMMETIWKIWFYIWEIIANIHGNLVDIGVYRHDNHPENKGHVRSKWKFIAYHSSNDGFSMFDKCLQELNRETTGDCAACRFIQWRMVFSFKHWKRCCPENMGLTTHHVKAYNKCIEPWDKGISFSIGSRWLSPQFYESLFVNQNLI